MATTTRHAMLPTLINKYKLRQITLGGRSNLSFCYIYGTKFGRGYFSFAVMKFLWIHNIASILYLHGTTYSLQQRTHKLLWSFRHPIYQNSEVPGISFHGWQGHHTGVIQIPGISPLNLNMRQIKEKSKTFGSHHIHTIWLSNCCIA